MTYQELEARLRDESNDQTLNDFLKALYQRVQQQIVNRIPQDYHGNPAIVGVYDNFFTKFKPIPNVPKILQGYRNMYGDLSQENINRQILSLRDFTRNIKYFESLTTDAKFAYTLHKRNSDILGTLLRLSKSKFKQADYRPITMKQILRNINLMHSIFQRGPKTTKSFIVYRAERDFDDRKEIKVGTVYELEGYTSFSVDPRIGYFFNKTLQEKKGKFFMDYVWKVTIPEGARIVIPAIDRAVDPEFEILLQHHSKILVESIVLNKGIEAINPENKPQRVVVQRLIIGKLVL
jgi:hypothetical protein